MIKVDREIPFPSEENVFGRLAWQVKLMDPAHGTYIEAYNLGRQDLLEAGWEAVDPLVKEE